jgi:hypothetical protein
MSLKVWNNYFKNKTEKGLGSVAGPVIQATGRSEFEDGLESGDFCLVHLFVISSTAVSSRIQNRELRSQ